MKKLNILFTTNHADTLGNAGRLGMLNFLIKSFDITVITNQIDFMKKILPNCDIKEIINLKKSKIPIINKIKYWGKIGKQINGIDCDAVVIFGDNAASAIWINKPVFQYIHQYGNRSEKPKLIIKRIIKFIINSINKYLYIRGLKKSKMNFVVSRPIIELLNQKGVKNLKLTHHGIDLKKYQNPKIYKEHNILEKLKNENYFVIAYTGWVTENRGFQLMLDSIREAVQKDKKICLVIAGDDNEFSRRIDEYKKKYNLAKNIFNYGIVDVSLIPGILYYSDVCFSFLDDVPAYRISPPQKVVEYFAAGKPVICNKIETNEWLVENGRTGFVLDKDPFAVSNAILRLKENKKLYNTMCTNALEESQKYDIEQIYGIMVEKLNEVV